MGKIVGAICLMGGIVSLLYSWLQEQRVRHQRLEEILIFLQKSIFAMEEERVRVIEHLEGYQSRDKLLEETLREVAIRLRRNIYPSGQQVWEEVFREKMHSWGYEEETFDVILSIGNGLFGKKRSENVCFLQKSLRQLEQLKRKQMEKDMQERKVWIPVSMLSGIMLMIILI